MMEWSGGGQWKGRRKRNGMMPTSKNRANANKDIYSAAFWWRGSRRGHEQIPVRADLQSRAVERFMIMHNVKNVGFVFYNPK